jgi:ubiquinone/menaquinone biosynthesis C-methylase UbiE
MRGHRWFAAAYDLVNRGAERRVLGPIRRALLADAPGLVLEVGAGTGASFPHYRAAARVVAAEPDPYMLRRARRRAAAAPRPVVLVQCAAEALPVRDGAVDQVVAALVLCSVADEARALAEARRVLRPGGGLRFLEHVRADGLLGRLQDALTPAWRRVAADCRLNRRTADRIGAGGFRIVRLERRPLPGPATPLVWGIALAGRPGDEAGRSG